MSGQSNLVALKTTNNKYSSDAVSLFPSLEGEIKEFCLFVWLFFLSLLFYLMQFLAVQSLPQVILCTVSKGYIKQNYLILMHFAHTERKNVVNAIVCKDRNGFVNLALIKTVMFVFLSSPPGVAIPEFILKLVKRSHIHSSLFCGQMCGKI